MDIFSIVGPVMIGPSSSHTAGACKIGNIASLILGENPVSAYITLYGSFAKTGRGHGTDKAILAGILGFQSDDIRLKKAYEYAEDMDLDYHFEFREKMGAHPNTAEIRLRGASGNNVVITGSSIGGGRVRITSINDFPTDFDGMHHTTIVIHKDEPGVIASVTRIMAEDGVNIARMSLHRSRRGGTSALVTEADQGCSKESIFILNKIKPVIRIYVIPKL